MISGRTRKEKKSMSWQKIRKLLIGVFVFVILALCVKGCIMVGSVTYSEGERTGTITKFSHKGLVVRTWEGELNMGGLEVGGKASVWEFSVDDPAIVEQVHKAQRAGGRWTLKYRQQMFKQSWRGSTEYFVTDLIQAGKE